jgi:hypothetical protein
LPRATRHERPYLWKWSVRRIKGQPEVIKKRRENYFGISLLQTYTKWADQTGEQCVAEFPHSVHARLIQGEILDRKKLYDLGARQYLPAAISDPFYAPIFFLLGRGSEKNQGGIACQRAFARCHALLPSAERVDLPVAEVRAIPQKDGGWAANWTLHPVSRRVHRVSQEPPLPSEHDSTSHRRRRPFRTLAETPELTVG